MKKVVERNSPLLCLVLLYRLGIIRYYDAELAYTPHGDVDVALMKKGRPFIAYDVKNSFSGETEKAIERIKAFGILRLNRTFLSANCLYEVLEHIDD